MIAIVPLENRSLLIPPLLKLPLEKLSNIDEVPESLPPPLLDDAPPPLSLVTRLLTPCTALTLVPSAPSLLLANELPPDLMALVRQLVQPLPGLVLSPPTTLNVPPYILVRLVKSRPLRRHKLLSSELDPLDVLALVLARAPPELAAEDRPLLYVASDNVT